MNLAEMARDLYGRRDYRGVLALDVPADAGLSPDEQGFFWVYRTAAAEQLEDYLTAGQAAESAYKLLPRLQDVKTCLAVTLAKAGMLGAFGDHQTAAAMMRDAISTYRPQGEMIPFCHWRLGRETYDGGDREQGLRLIESAARKYLEFGSTEAFWSVREWAAALIEAGRSEDGLRTLALVEDRYDTAPPIHRSRFARWKAKALSLTGNRSDAVVWANAALSLAVVAESSKEETQAKTVLLDIANSSK